MVATIGAAIAPGIALLSYFYLRDRFESEPIHMVVRSFFYGILLVFPLMVVQFAVNDEFAIGSFGQAFIVNGLLEEFFKWFVVYYTAYKHVAFNEHYDGIVYAVAVSLGFATMENFIYLWSNGLSIAFMRAILPVSGHALFAVTMGYYLGKGKFTALPGKKARLLMLSVLFPVVLHGMYDWILLSGIRHVLWVMAVFMVSLWIFSLRRVTRASVTPPNTVL